MKVRKRHFLKTDKAREVLAVLNAYEPEASLEGTLELAEADGSRVLLLNGAPIIVFVGDEPFFTVKGALGLKPRRHLVTVDAGAVKFIINGADVMSPGIVAADSSIVPGDLVVIIEEQYHKALAVGTALISGPAMVYNTTGKAVKTLHHIGDELWNLRV